MRVWLSKSSEVPLREQLIRQIILGIIADDLRPGQKLPSTRELAHRFRVHSNTVSAAYRDLARRGWVELRKGSGVYVRPRDADVFNTPEFELDHMISTFLRAAREKGFSLAELQARVKHWLDIQPPDHFLVIESDVELRNILIAEIKEATGFRASGMSLEECHSPDLLAGAAPVVLYGRAEQVRALLPPGMLCLELRLRSVTASLKAESLPSKDALITVASHWDEFLNWARTILVAAGVDSDALDLRNARAAGWQKGLRSSAIVITDALTAGQIPEGCPTRIFRIIASSSLKELTANYTNMHE